MSTLKRSISITLLAVGLLMFSGCGQTADKTESPEALPLTDSDLSDMIQEKINSDASLRAADLDVSADASGSRAMISGTVSSETLRARAIELAHSARKGMTLDVKIDVRPPDVARTEWTEEYSRAASRMARNAGDTVSDSLDDTWIHTKIVAKLIGDADVSERKINVDVDKNVVTLRGVVTTSSEKAEAARIAKETTGVVRVVNLLKVDPAA